MPPSNDTLPLIMKSAFLTEILRFLIIMLVIASIVFIYCFIVLVSLFSFKLYSQNPVTLIEALSISSKDALEIFYKCPLQMLGFYATAGIIGASSVCPKNWEMYKKLGIRPQLNTNCSAEILIGSSIKDTFYLAKESLDTLKAFEDFNKTGTSFEKKYRVLNSDLAKGQIKVYTDYHKISKGNSIIDLILLNFKKLKGETISVSLKEKSKKSTVLTLKSQSRLFFGLGVIDYAQNTLNIKHLMEFYKTHSQTEEME